MKRNSLLAVTLVAATAVAQQPVHVEPAVYVTAIDVVAQVHDASGRVPRNLRPEDLIVIEDGVEQKVIGVDFLEPPAPVVPSPVAPARPATSPVSPDLWEIVLYFETQLSGGLSRKQVANALIKQAGELARMGQVDVILASPSARPLVRASRDPEAIRQALRTVANASGTNWLARHRRDFYSLVIMASSPMGGAQMPAANVRPYVDDELQLIARFRSNLVRWLSSYPKRVPRALFVVTDGFDLDPVEFYASALAPSEQMVLRSYVQQSELGRTTGLMSQVLAAGGWTTMGIPGWPDMVGWTDDSSVSGIGRAHSFSSQFTTSTPGVKSMFYRPLDPLYTLAEATGGSVVPNTSRLGQAISELGDRVKVTYQVNRPPDGKARKLEIRSRHKGWKVAAMQWASSTTPEEMATLRALSLMTQHTAAGELHVTSAADWETSSPRRFGTIHGTARLDPIAPLLRKDAQSSFRVTFAVHVPPKDAFVVSRFVSKADISGGTFRYRAPIDIPATASLIVVTVEEISTGVWGSARVVIR